MSNVPAELVRNSSDEEAIKYGCYYDQNEADKVIHFLESTCKLSKGTAYTKAGDYMQLIPWQTDLCRRLYGWRWPDGRRRFQEVYLSTSKKAGKSTTEAGLGVYHLTSDGVESAEVYSVAKDRPQAKITFEEAAKMIESSNILGPQCKIKKSINLIEHLITGSKWKVCPSNPEGLNGVNASAILVDEFHVVKDEMKDRKSTRLNSSHVSESRMPSSA